MKIIHINDSILNTPLNHIAHGVNCQNVMGSGVAKVLFDKWPSVKEEYHAYCNRFIKEYNYKPENFLGRAQDAIEVEPGKFVYNLFTQVNFGYDGQRYVNYQAVVHGLKFAHWRSDEKITQVAIPKIGCGLAGGSWFFMEQLLSDALYDRDIELWVYDTTKYGKPDIV